MLTVREAMQRCTLNGVDIKRKEQGSTDWCVTLKEWTREQCHKFRYITDDLEDAVITGSKLRNDVARYV